MTSRFRFSPHMRRISLGSLALAASLITAIGHAGGGGGATISIVDNNTHIDRGVFYSSSSYLTASGGTPPYSFSASAGVPSGIVVNSDGTVTGVTCGSNGTFKLTVSATDSIGNSGSTTNATLIVNAAPAGGCSLSFSSSTVPNGSAGVAYSTTLSATGGTAPYTYSLASGTLPTGLTLSSGGVISGTPSAAGTYNFSILATDSAGSDGAESLSLTIMAGGGSAPIAGSVSQTVPYNSGSASATAITLNLSGGAATSVTVASSPSHGAATASGTSISYTPTAHFAGSDSFTYTATNSTGTSTAATVSITIAAPTLSVSPASLTAATVGSATTQSITASGGFAPYSYAVTSGALPTGVSLSSSGSLSGTPTAAGSYTFTITATDSGTGSAATGSRSYGLTVNPPPPSAGSVTQTVAYNGGSAIATAITLSLSGGAATSVTVATTPTHGAATASGTTITYTPTAHYAGSDSFTYTATNAGGTSAPATVSLTISAPVLTLSPSSLPAGGAGASYAQTISASGGQSPYNYTVSAGSLPSGMTLNAATGSLSGTPSTSGSYSFTVTVTDSTTGTAATASHTYPLTINSATPGAPTAGNVSQTVTYNAGSASPTAINLNLGGGAASAVAVAAAPTHGNAAASGVSISYVPTAHFIGTDSFTYTATNTGGTSAAGTVSITVSAPALTVGPASLGPAIAGSNYSQTLSVTGGAAPYTFAVSAGTLPPGLSLTSAGTLSGTPSTLGNYTFTITISDSSTGTAATTSRTLTLAVSATQTAPPTVANVSQTVAFNAGGATPTAVTLSLAGGSATSVTVVQAPVHGVATASGIAVTYTPNANFVGADSFTYSATNSGGTSAVATVTVQIAAPSLSATTTVATTSLVQYNASAPFTPISVSGGVAPLSFSVSPTLPPGLQLNSTTGQITGTPTTSSPNTDYTMTVTDAMGQTSKVTFRVAVTLPAPALTITPVTLPPARDGSNYTVAFSAGGGTAPYTFSISTGNLPAGLKLSANGTLSGKTRTGGTFSIQVTDAAGVTGSRSYTLVVNARPDPTADTTVTGTLGAQAQMAKRFATAQISNVSTHLQQAREQLDPCSNRNNVVLNIADPELITRSDGTSGPSSPATTLTGRNPVAEPRDTEEDRASNIHKDGDSCLNRALFSSGRLAFWTGGSVDRGAMDVATADRNHFASSGLTLGLDGQLTKRLLIGAAMGFGWERAHTDASGSQVHGDSTNGVLYALYRFDQLLTFDALLGYGRLSASNSRWVSDDQTWVSGKRGGANLFASIGLTAKFAAREFRLEPYVRADWIDTRLAAYQEAGTTDLALSYDESSNSNQSLALGITLLRDFPINARNLLTPVFSIQQQRTFNSSQAQTLYYTDIGPDLGYSIRATALPISLTSGHIGLRWHSRMGLDAELGMGYSLGDNSYIQRSYRAMLHAAF